MEKKRKSRYCPSLLWTLCKGKNDDAKNGRLDLIPLCDGSYQVPGDEEGSPEKKASDAKNPEDP